MWLQHVIDDQFVCDANFRCRVIAELILPSRQLTILELRWLRNWWETRLLSWPFSDFPSRTAPTWGLRWSCYDGWGLVMAVTESWDREAHSAESSSEPIEPMLRWGDMYHQFVAIYLLIKIRSFWCNRINIGIWLCIIESRKRSWDGYITLGRTTILPVLDS